MTKETIKEVVEKLVGRIQPCGISEDDEKYFENLQNMCWLVNELVTQIDEMSYTYQNYKAASIQRSSAYARKFLTVTLGIEE